MNDPLLGAVLGDRYLILSRLGVGGMGAVYRAQHTTLKRDLAIKVLLPEFGGKDEFVRRFEREAESASRLAHPNIIAVTDFGRTPDGLLFLAMEYLDGRSLTSLIREGPLGVPRALGIARQILAGLNRAHGAGVVHRDLKPDNIMLIERDGTRDFVKILDFGIAKLTDPEPGREALTQAGMVFGTPEYLSPEQALGDKIDARADLYAFGVILFEMLIGQRPFESEDKVRIISMHLSHAVPRFATANPAVEVPLALEEVVMQTLDKQRDNRFSSASALLTALDEAELIGTAAADAVRTTAAVAGAARAALSSQDRVTANARATPAAPPRAADALQGQSRGAPAASASPSPPRWKRRLLIGAAGVALAVTAAVELPHRPTGPRGGATAHLPPPQKTSSELAARIGAVEGLLSAGESLKGRVALEQLLAENPRNARVRYLLGRLAFAEDRYLEGLDRYREAVSLDPGLRGDPVLLEHLGVALGKSKVADSALDLAIDKVGGPAAELLVRVANGSGELHRRQRAARALEELGEGKRVDLVMLHVTELKSAAACEDKKPLVVALGASDDVRALPMLRAQRPHGIEAFFGRDAETGCMRPELADAIARLEAKLPSDKQRTDKTKAPARRTSARPSLFRGR
jgi:tetratricopeptide (TPR) repeat protein